MKKSILVLFLGLFCAGFAFANEISWEEIHLGKTDLKTVLVDPENPRIIYAGVRGSIFKTEDGGSSWRTILNIRAQNNNLNLLLSNPVNKNNLLAVTGNGLYSSDNKGRSWKRVFRGRNYLENDCSSLAVLYSTILLGTKGGLFISRDSGKSWKKSSGEIGKSAISAISCNLKEPSCAYAASIGGVFKTRDSGQSWERIFVAERIDNENDAEMEEDNEDNGQKENAQIRYLRHDPKNPNYVYLATSKGVIFSRNGGTNWESISSYGLLSRDVRLLKVSQEGALYAVTKSGIFEYKNQRWHELSIRLVSKEIRFLDLDSQGNLYAACDSGLFRAERLGFSSYTQVNMDAACHKEELKIGDIQKAAIQYAQVEPEKIMRWREQAARKAWLPKVSVGVDRNTSDLWHWEGGSTTKSEDDILRRGRDNLDWDVTLSWDLGELIWNDAQTSIDVRSRLLVQLRDDVLDEVTKLYFERIRVKMELDNLSIEDRKKRFEKELRLQELAAYLDGLTGGYFSSQIK